MERHQEGQREHRRFLRISSEAAVRIQPVGGDIVEDQVVRLFDISEGGIGFIHPREMQFGQRIVARFDNSGESDVPYRVVYCTPIERGTTFRVGAQRIDDDEDEDSERQRRDDENARTIDRISRAILD